MHDHETPRSRRSRRAPGRRRPPPGRPERAGEERPEPRRTAPASPVRTTSASSTPRTRTAHQQGEQQNALEHEPPDVDSLAPHWAATTSRLVPVEIGVSRRHQYACLTCAHEPVGDEVEQRGSSGTAAARRRTGSGTSAPRPAPDRCPRPATAIAAVIVVPGSSGFSENSAPAPAPPAMNTTIVSPMARETARMQPGHEPRDRGRHDDPQAGRDLPGARARTTPRAAPSAPPAWRPR